MTSCDIDPLDPHCVNEDTYDWGPVPFEVPEIYEPDFSLKKQNPSQGSGSNFADFSVVDAVENKASKAIQEGM